MWNYSERRIFNEILIEEIKNDFLWVNMQNLNLKILDCGCGDGYFLNKISSVFPKSFLYCLEPNLKLHQNQNQNIIYFKHIDEIIKLNEPLDIITLVDVLYLLSPKDLNLYLKLFSHCLSNHGIVYIILGIYKESTGINIFKKFFTKNYINIYLYSLNTLHNKFKHWGFKTFYKRLNYSSIFGFFPPEDIEDISEYLDYLYKDKLLIKLIKKN